MEKVTRQAPGVTIEVVPWRGSANFKAEFARTIDLVISIGDAFKGFPPRSIPTRCACGTSRHPVAETKAARRFLQRAARRRRDPPPELIPDQHVAAHKGHRAADCARRTRLYRGADIIVAHGPRGVCAAPADLGADETIALKAVTPPLTPESTTAPALMRLGPSSTGIDMAAETDAGNRAGSRRTETTNGLIGGAIPQY